MPHSGNERRKRPHDRDETGENDRLAAVFLVKMVRFLEVALFEYFGVRVAKQTLPEETSDRIIGRIPQYGGRHQHQDHQVHVHMVGRQRRERPGHEQQRIARQERRHDQSRFAKDNHKQDRINPHPVLRDQFGHMHVDVQYEINCILQILHYPGNYRKILIGFRCVKSLH